MDKKYKLTDETITVDNHTLYRIRALRTLGMWVTPGDLGGWIESESNLSHEAHCWVYDDAKVWENARVNKNASILNEVRVSGNAVIYEDTIISGNAKVFGNARLYGNCRVYGNAVIYEDTIISGNAKVFGNARLYGNCRVYGNAMIYEDARLSGNARVYGIAAVSGDVHISGTAWVCGNIFVGAGVKLDHGIWNRLIRMNDKEYLISTTLRQVLVSGIDDQRFPINI